MSSPSPESTETNPRWVKAQQAKLSSWKVPPDTWNYLIERRLVDLVGKIVDSLNQDPVFVSIVLGHALRQAERRFGPQPGFNYERIYDLFVFGRQRKLYDEILKLMAPLMYDNPESDFDSILQRLSYHPHTMEELVACIPVIQKQFAGIRRSRRARAAANWIMSQLRPQAIGNVCMEELRGAVDAAVEGGLPRRPLT